MAPTVLNNPSWNSIYNHSMVKHDIVILCSSSDNRHLSGGCIFCILLDGLRMLFKYYLLLDSMKTLKFWNNKPDKRITMIRRRIIGINNPQMKNVLVQGYLNETYRDAILSQSTCDVF